MNTELKDRLISEFAEVLEVTREEKWPVFSEASKQSKVKPYEALSRILVRILEAEVGDDLRGDSDEITEEKLESFFLAAFVADALDLLDGDKKLRLAHLFEQGGLEASWQDVIRSKYNIDADYVRQIYQLLCLRWDKAQALLFINRGLNNPRPVESLVEVCGENLFDEE